MKLCSVIAMAFMLLPQSLAFASFSGHWVGGGHAQDGTGWAADCEKISYTFVHTPKTLEVIGGEVKCGGYEATFDAATLRIEDEKLFYGDLEVGTITNDLLHVVFEDDIIYLSYRFKIIKDPENPKINIIEYQQDEIFDDSDLSIEGKLMRLASPKETH